MSVNGILATLTATAVIAAMPSSQPTSRISRVLDSVAQTSPSNVEKPEEKAEEVIKPEPKWVGNGFTENETIALNFFQEYGIKDKVALATLLGNIQQESRFHPNICEGGARIRYPHCHRGGYGLIQWTTSFRYWGLGNYAKINKCSTEDIKCQLGYLVTEREWKEALWRFKTPDKSISFYMKGAYRWLGWGIYGNRGYYTQKYMNMLSFQ